MSWFLSLRGINRNWNSLISSNCVWASIFKLTWNLNINTSNIPEDSRLLETYKLRRICEKKNKIAFFDIGFYNTRLFFNHTTKLEDFDIQFKLQSDQYYPSCWKYKSFINSYIRHCWNFGSGENSVIGRLFGTGKDYADELYTSLESYVQNQLFIPYKQNYNVNTKDVENDIISNYFSDYFSVLSLIATKTENHSFVVSKPYFLSEKHFKISNVYLYDMKNLLSKTIFIKLGKIENSL